MLHFFETDIILGWTMLLLIASSQIPKNNLLKIGPTEIVLL